MVFYPDRVDYMIAKENDGPNHLHLQMAAQCHSGLEKVNDYSMDQDSLVSKSWADNNCYDKVAAWYSSLSTRHKRGLYELDLATGIHGALDDS